MKDILNELISDIILLGEARKKPASKPATKKPAVKMVNGRRLRDGESEDFPGYFHRGGNYYSNVSKTGQVTHKNADGKMVALTNQEKQQYRAKHASTSPTTTPARPRVQPKPRTQQRTSAQPSIDRQQTIDDLEAKASNTQLGERKRQILKQLVDAMKSGDTATIQKVINDNGIVMGGSGRLKFTDSDKAGLADEQLSAKIFTVLKNMGVTITGRKGKEVDVSTDRRASEAEQFKPQVIFGDAVDTLDITPAEDGDGIVVEGTRIEEITDEEAREIEERWVSAARQRMGEEFTQEWEDNVREYVQARIREQRANIKFLREVSEGSGNKQYNQFPKNDESSEKATARIVGALSTLVDSHLSEDKREAAKQQVSAMASSAQAMAQAKTAQERRAALRAYNKALSEFMKLCKGSALGRNMKYVAETLKALQSVAQGKTVLIPASDSFPLADVIAIGRSPITGETSIELFLVSVEEGITASAAESVKFDDGSAGVTHQKDAHSEFGPVRGPGGSEISGEEVGRDLVGMGGVPRKNAIFTRDGKLDPAERKRIISEFEKYGDVAREYFGLPTDPNAEGYLNAEQLYEFLSYGTALVCVDGDPPRVEHGPVLAAGDESRGSQNPQQWQAWNALGMLHEAVHNSTVTQQYYQTAQFTTGGLVVADGVRTMAKAVFQPYKGLVSGGEKSPRVGKAPNSSMVSFSVPAEENDLRSGNPCNK